MDEPVDPYADDDEHQPQHQGPKALRRAAEEGRRAKAEADALRRRVALLEAGVDAATEVGKLFLAGYAGPHEDPAAVRAAWEKVIGEVRSVDDISADVRASTPLRQALANGSPADIPVHRDVHPHRQMADAYESALSGGSTQDQAVAAGIDQILRAGSRGDKRVIAPKESR